MNIEEANDNLIMLKYFLQEEGDENWEKYCEAIETLLTAYEKEKGENKRLRKCHLQYEEMTGIDLLLPSEEE